MKNLESKDNKKVSKALDRAEKNGTIKWVEPLLEAFSSREEDALKTRMRTLLSSIKLSAAEDVFLEFYKRTAKSICMQMFCHFFGVQALFPPTELI